MEGGLQVGPEPLRTFIMHTAKRELAGLKILNFVSIVGERSQWALSLKPLNAGLTTKHVIPCQRNALNGRFYFTHQTHAFRHKMPTSCEYSLQLFHTFAPQCFPNTILL